MLKYTNKLFVKKKIGYFSWEDEEFTVVICNMFDGMLKKMNWIQMENVMYTSIFCSLSNVWYEWQMLFMLIVLCSISKRWDVWSLQTEEEKETNREHIKCFVFWNV